MLLLGVVIIIMATTSTGAAYMRTAYDAKGTYCKTAALYGRPVQIPRKSGVDPTAGAWKEQFSISAKLGDLKAGKLYAVDRIEAHGGVAIAVHGMLCRLKHSDFDGCRPGGMICSQLKGTQEGQGNESLEFDTHGIGGMHPVFSSDSPLTLELLSTAAIAPLYWTIVCVEVAAAEKGSEDINAGYSSTLDDAQTFQTLAPVAGDSFEIASSRGNAVLKECGLFGVYVVYARISCTEDVMQPNALYITRNAYNSSEIRQFRNVPIPLTTTMTIELNSYVVPT